MFVCEVDFTVTAGIFFVPGQVYCLYLLRDGFKFFAFDGVITVG